MDLLLDHDADINTMSKLGQTLLMSAVQSADEQGVEHFISRGADVKSPLARALDGARVCCLQGRFGSRHLLPTRRQRTLPLAMRVMLLGSGRQMARKWSRNLQVGCPAESVLVTSSWASLTERTSEPESGFSKTKKRIERACKVLGVKHLPSCTLFAPDSSSPFRLVSAGRKPQLTRCIMPDYGLRNYL